MSEIAKGANAESIFIVMMQNEAKFREMAKVAASGNYLFDLTNRIMPRRAPGLIGSLTYNSFGLGVQAYQLLKLFTEPSSPSFVVPPESTVAELTVVDVLGGVKDYGLIELGERNVDLSLNESPFFIEATEEIINKYSPTSGDSKIALAGAALMGFIVERAESRLVA